MIMASVVVLVVEGTIEEMKRGCHTLGLRCCAVIKLEGDTLCYCGCGTTMETKVDVKSVRNTTKVKWGPVGDQTGCGFICPMPDCAHAESVRRGVMLYVNGCSSCHHFIIT